MRKRDLPRQAASPIGVASVSCTTRTDRAGLICTPYSSITHPHKNPSSAALIHPIYNQNAPSATVQLYRWWKSIALATVILLATSYFTGVSRKVNIRLGSSENSPYMYVNCGMVNH